MQRDVYTAQLHAKRMDDKAAELLKKSADDRMRWALHMKRAEAEAARESKRAERELERWVGQRL